MHTPPGRFDADTSSQADAGAVRSLNRRYIVALLLVAALAIAAFAVLTSAMIAEADRSHVINVAGRQRMLSQRIALFATRLAELEPGRPAHAENLGVLRETVSLFERSHMGLTMGDRGMGLSGHLSPVEREIYYGTPDLDRLSLRYIALARTIIDEATAERPVPAAELADLNALAASTLLVFLDQAVNAFDIGGTSAISRMIWIEAGIFAALLLLLVAEAVFIFRPAATTVTDALRKQTEARLQAERMARMRRELLATMSHELRTPLYGLIGHMDLIDRSKLSAEDTEHMDLAVKSGELLKKTVNTVLDFSALETGKLSVSPQITDLVKVMRDTADILRPRAEAKKLELRLDLDESLPAAVMTDPLRIQQIVMNLAGNSIKFTNEGTIILTVRDLGAEEGAVGGVIAAANGDTADGGALLTMRRVALVVQDTGHGMDDAQVATIFDAFTTFARSEAGAESTGLGMAITQQIVQLMGGHIDIDSTPGQGTVITVTLPLPEVPAQIVADQAAGKTEGGTVPANHAVAGKSGTALECLIAEDNPINAQLLQKNILTMGQIPTMVGNGEEACQTLFSDPDRFQVILMDIHMPVLDGEMALERIQSQLRGRQPPIWACTANALPEDIKRYRELGFAAIVTKPIDMAELAVRLNRLAESTAPGGLKTAGGPETGNTPDTQG